MLWFWVLPEVCPWLGMLELHLVHRCYCSCWVIPSLFLCWSMVEDLEALGLKNWLLGCIAQCFGIGVWCVWSCQEGMKQALLLVVHLFSFWHGFRCFVHSNVVDKVEQLFCVILALSDLLWNCLLFMVDQ